MNYHREADKQQKCISRSSGGWKAKIKVLADTVSGKSPIPRPRPATFSLCPHGGWKGWGCSLGPVYQGSSSIPKGCTLMTDSPQAHPLPNASHLAFGLPHTTGRGHKRSVQSGIRTPSGSRRNQPHPCCAPLRETGCRTSWAAHLGGRDTEQTAGLRALRWALYQCGHGCLFMTENS